MLFQFYGNVQSSHKREQDIKIIKNLTDAITELQKERGLTSGFLKNYSNELYKKILKQRFLTDKSIEKLDYKSKHIIHIASIREKINKHEISSYDEFIQYTRIIQTLLNRYIHLVSKIDNNKILKEFMPFTSLLIMQESLGKIRGSLNGIFAKQIYDKKLYYIALESKGQYDLAKQRYLTLALPEFKLNFEKITKDKNYIWMKKQINKYLTYKPKTINVNANEWFEKATNVITQFNVLEKNHLNFIQKTTEELRNKNKHKIFLYIVLYLFTTISVLFLGLKLKDSILENISLLNQYKDIVDRDSIVSKTDKYGRITYANDKFCEISGYKREELIGKPHNIVRHPDMPKEVFKDMWKTIKAKKSWSGIIKNRKKDGSYYIVEAFIEPILDAKGNIKEFIALRNDITEIIDLHEEIEKTQEEIILKMGEIGETRSRETGHHVKRVAKYSEILGKYYGLDEKELKYLTIASPMHDIGKVGIPDAILDKPGKLTEKEWKIMQTHAQIGYELFQNSKRELLQTAAIIAHQHHEKYDGSGYPQGLSKEDIHIFGRITALADVFDALGSDRCYKKAWEDEKIFKFIKENRGKHFDPRLVDIFFEHLDEFLEVRDIYSDKSYFMKENQS